MISKYFEILLQQNMPGKLIFFQLEQLLNSIKNYVYFLNFIMLVCECEN